MRKPTESARAWFLTGFNGFAPCLTTLYSYCTEQIFKLRNSTLNTASVLDQTAGISEHGVNFLPEWREGAPDPEVSPRRLARVERAEEVHRRGAEGRGGAQGWEPRRVGRY